MNKKKIILTMLVAGLLVATSMLSYSYLSQHNMLGFLSEKSLNQVQPDKPTLPEMQNQTHQKKPDRSGLNVITGQSAQAASPYTTEHEQRIIQLYKQVSPSVVNITTRSFEYNHFYEPVPREGAGSGFVIDNSGHVVTNYHVVNGAQRYMVAFANMEESYPAQLVGIDPRSDLAVLKVNAPASLLKPVRLGDSSQLQIGQTAIAVGNPFGIGQTITTGVISSLGRKIRVDDERVMSDMIQTDAAINRGNSGGPLFNLSGEVIGINTVILSPTGGSIGLGFAIPSNIAKRFIPELIRYGKAQYPWLGVSVLPLNARIAKALALPIANGLLVLQVYQGGSAAISGIRGGSKQVYMGNYVLHLGGDIIVAIDGRAVNSEADLTEYLERRKRVGDKVVITIIRGNQKINLPVSLTARSR